MGTERLAVTPVALNGEAVLRDPGHELIAGSSLPHWCLPLPRCLLLRHDRRRLLVAGPQQQGQE